MSLLIILIVVLILACVGYVGYIIRIKAINPKDIRINSIYDAKKLLELPRTAGPQRYLAKMA